MRLKRSSLQTTRSLPLVRPKSVAVDLMGYNYAIFGFCPYGPYWRQMSKIVTFEVLSNRCLDIFGHLRVSELKASMKYIYDFWVENTSDSNTMKMEMKK
ncbi:hypothetical protein LguiA_006704 [Lonicera macranthoides]